MNNKWSYYQPIDISINYISTNAIYNVHSNIQIDLPSDRHADDKIHSFVTSEMQRNRQQKALEMKETQV